MTCVRLDGVLCDAPTADALAHAKGCADCGPARAAWDAMDGEPASSASLDKVREAARAELRARPRARSWWVDAGILLAVNLGLVALASSVMSVSLVRPGESPMSRLGATGALLMLMVVGAWAAVRPGARPLRLGVLGLAALGAIWIGVGGSGLSGDRPFGSGIACGVTELAMSVIPLAVALWITSRFAYDLTRAIVGGVSVGAAGLLLLHLHCINGAADHLFTFHVLPWLGVALVGVAVRRSLPSRSFAP